MTDPKYTATPKPGSAPKRSLFQLIGDVPNLVRDLVKGELQQLKVEMIGKLKKFGIGGALIVVAVVILFFMFGVLLTAAVFGLAYVMPDWLAALVVAFVLLLVAALVAFIGYKRIQTGLPAAPTSTIARVKRDITMIKGMGK